ncbi:MAG: hypothetical protein ACOC0A_03755, partial [Planctomycetota bacterium]
LPEVWVLVAVGVAGTGFGSCFVVYASSMVDYYGADLFPHLYPICFLGYGLAGITGPAIGGWIEDATGTFTWAIMLSITIVFVCVTVLSIGFIRVAAPEEFQE